MSAMEEVKSLAECLRLPRSTKSVRIEVSTVTRMESTPPNPQWNFTDQSTCSRSQGPWFQGLDADIATRHLATLSRLQSLSLVGCDALVSLPEWLRELSTLQSLELHTCDALESLPEWLGELSALEKLKISWCAALVSLPECLGLLTKLTHLELSWNRQLESLPGSLGQLSVLQHLDLQRNKQLASLPDTLGQLSALQHLDLQGNKQLASLPDTLGQLSALQHLDLQGNKQLASLPNTMGQLSALQRLDLRGCSKLASLPESLGKLASLPESLGKLASLPESLGKLAPLPESRGKLPALDLIVSRLDPAAQPVKAFLRIIATAAEDDLLQAYLAGNPKLAERLLLATQELQRMPHDKSLMNEGVCGYWQELEGILAADAKHPGLLLQVADASACAEDIEALQHLGMPEEMEMEMRMGMGMGMRMEMGKSPGEELLDLLKPGIIEQLLLLSEQDLRELLSGSMESLKRSDLPPALTAETLKPLQKSPDVRRWLIEVKRLAVPPALAADYLWSHSSSSRDPDDLSFDPIRGDPELGWAVLAYLQQQRQESKQDDSWHALLQQALANIGSIAKSASSEAGSSRVAGGGRGRQGDSSRQQQGQPASSSSKQPQQQQQLLRMLQDPVGVYYLTNRNPVLWWWPFGRTDSPVVAGFTRDRGHKWHTGRITLREPAAPAGQDPWSTWTDNWTLTAGPLPPFARQQLLVFIHGYATSFKSAVQSAVRLAVQMHHGGPVLVFSWASWGSRVMYVPDRSRVLLAVDKLRDDVLRHFDRKVRSGNPAHMWACARLDIQNCSKPVQMTQHDMRDFSVSHRLICRKAATATLHEQTPLASLQDLDTTALSKRARPHVACMSPIQWVHVERHYLGCTDGQFPASRLLCAESESGCGGTQHGQQSTDAGA
jgi:hypothetical protein